MLQKLLELIASAESPSAPTAPGAGSWHNGAAARLNGPSATSNGNDGFSLSDELAAEQAAAAGAPQWNDRIEEQSLQVLELRNSQAAPEELAPRLQSLSQDYGQVQSLQVPLQPDVEQLARQALGLGDQQQGGNAPAPAEQGEGGGAGPAGGPATTGSSQPAGLPDAGGGGSWGEQDVAALDRALEMPAADFDNVFSDFAQGKEGNCASVAVIKAAMDTYDNQIFDQVAKTENGGYRVTLQDGQQVEVSGEELKLAGQAANFKGPSSEAKSYATLAYAVMAKQAQLDGNDGARTYSQALSSLNNGEGPIRAARYLGLRDQIQFQQAGGLNGVDAAVAWNGKHAVYVDSTAQGTRTDGYGVARSYDGTDTRGRRLTEAFTFRPRGNTALASSRRTDSGTRPAAASR